MIVGILTGRKGSKGFPGKNLCKVMGKPLSYYPMKAAIDCPEIDKVYMSTDDEKLMKLASDHDVEVMKRPARLCSDKALSEDVFIHAYKEAKKLNPGEEIELLALFMCNAPCVTAAMLSRGIKVLRASPSYDSAVTVSRYNMWSPLRARRIGEDGLLHPSVPFETLCDPKKLNCNRDSQGDIWFADMGVSIIRPRCLKRLEAGLLPQRWMGQKIYPLKQSGGFDIDYEWQMPQLEYWLKTNLKAKK